MRNELHHSNQEIGSQKRSAVRFLTLWIVLSAFLTSCESEQHSSKWFDEGTYTIGKYLDANQKEYSKFYRLLEEGKMLNTLYAYNPHGEGYTLFLPTDEAVDHFIQQNTQYGTFEKLLKDTLFVYFLTRYHTVNRKVHSDEFPDGALTDKTLSGDRLTVGFYTDGKNQVIKVNNEVPVIKPNLDMTNGYIHIISEILQKSEISGYDWLQQQDNYSILAQAMELSGIRGKIKWNKYTILAENDTVYRRNGISNIQDLISRIATPGVPYTSSSNTFYLFTAFHILSGEYYMNDFNWGNYTYLTLANKTVTIDAGKEIRINPGVDIYGKTISGTGDTTLIDYILPVWEASNRMTRTGPVHSVSQLLFYGPFPK
jgi:uncharacterized surface protein with fasciclin (FAS1) repeats